MPVFDDDALADRRPSFDAVILVGDDERIPLSLDLALGLPVVG